MFGFQGSGGSFDHPAAHLWPLVNIALYCSDLDQGEPLTPGKSSDILLKTSITYERNKNDIIKILRTITWSRIMATYGNAQIPDYDNLLLLIKIIFVDIVDIPVHRYSMYL